MSASKQRSSIHRLWLPALFATLMLSACDGSKSGADARAPAGTAPQPSSSTTSQAAPAPARTQPADPELASLYQQSCFSCHGTGAGGAPRTGSPDWAPRAAQGMDVLLERTVNGYKGMPPLGMCMDCSEEEFKALIRFMAGMEPTE